MNHAKPMVSVLFIAAALVLLAEPAALAQQHVPHQDIPGVDNPTTPTIPNGGDQRELGPDELNSCLRTAHSQVALEELRKRALAAVEKNKGDALKFARETPKDNTLAQCMYYARVVEFYSK